MRLAVAATAPFGADVLRRLAKRHEVAYVVTRPDRPKGRGRKVAAPPAKEVAQELGLEVRQPERPEELGELGVDIVVAVAYGALIPKDLLDRALWLNIHPSLLPRWRGAAPVERAIMAGDEETGVAIIRLVEELDAGPIGAIGDFPIGLDDDAACSRSSASRRRRARSRMPRRSARRTACSTGRARRWSSTIASAPSRPTSAPAGSFTAGP